MKKYAVIEYHEPHDMYFNGMFDTYHEAIGYVMTQIWLDKRHFNKDGDEFEYTEPSLAESVEGEECSVEGDDYIKVTNKKASGDKAETYYYYILDAMDGEGV